MRLHRAHSLWALLATGGLAADSSSTDTAYLADGYLDLGIASDAYEKAKAFVATLNNTQKIAVVTGSSVSDSSDSWSPYVASIDGVAGLTFYFYVSSFPMINALTQTWDRDLIAAQFKAVGEEYIGTGYNWVSSAILAPLGRVPQAGRLPEAFSPDPFLSGIAAAEGIQAQQTAKAVAAVRHFLLYEQETNRDTAQGTSTFSSNVDDKTLHEVYMWPWADAVKSGAVAVMCATPRVNDTHSCESNFLLSGKLKTELGFPGLVYPDFPWAQRTSYNAAIAGLDYSPGSLNRGLWSQDILAAGVANGSLPQARLDDMAVRSALPFYFVGRDTADLPPQTSASSFRDVRGNHSTLIRQVGGESFSLLKNNNNNGGGLPLVKPHAISLFGAHAGPSAAGPNYRFTAEGTETDEIFNGHLATSKGTGQTSLSYLITPFNSITQRAVLDNSMIWWILNNSYTQTEGDWIYARGTGLSPSIPRYASLSTVCLVFINSWGGEGVDRSELYNTEQDDLVTLVADNCNNTVVVVNVSGPRILEAWIEHENVTAVIYSGLLGQESGNAIADVLYGDVNPSGKLIHTIAKQTSDYPASICETLECDFSEGIYIDYRHFDKQEIEPRYPFGHGLSYTSFTYGTVTAKITNTTAISSKYPTGKLSLGGLADLFEEVIAVTTTLQNSGSLDGAEVAQLYVSFPEEAEQPLRVLRGFEKAFITSGQTASISFSVRRRDVSYWDVVAQNWAIASGTYTFAVGSSSRDIRGNATLTV